MPNLVRHDIFFSLMALGLSLEMTIVFNCYLLKRIFLNKTLQYRFLFHVKLLVVVRLILIFIYLSRNNKSKKKVSRSSPRMTLFSYKPIRTCFTWNYSLRIRLVLLSIYLLRNNKSKKKISGFRPMPSTLRHFELDSESSSAWRFF